MRDVCIRISESAFDLRLNFDDKNCQFCENKLLFSSNFEKIIF